MEGVSLRLAAAAAQRPPAAAEADAPAQPPSGPLVMRFLTHAPPAHKYEMGDLLGQGTFGCVYSARRAGSATTFAIKKLKPGVRGCHVGRCRSDMPEFGVGQVWL